MVLATESAVVRITKAKEILIMDTNGYSLSDIRAASGGNDGFGCDGFGGWWGLLFLIVLMGGFGGNGLFGNGNTVDTDRDVLKTSSDTQRDVLNTKYDTAVLGFQNQIAMMKGQYDTDMLIAQNRFDTLLGFKDQQAQMAQCCCDLKALTIQENQKTRDLINANMVTELERKLNDAKSEISNLTQTQSILDKIDPRYLSLYLAGQAAAYIPVVKTATTTSS